MFVDFALLIAGLALLLAGGRGLVSGASMLARSLGVSELVVGLTVVAFGTSVPELCVNALAAFRGDAAIAFGNVIGSNLANVALVLGISALLRSLVIESAIVSREIPMMLLATAVTIVLGLDRIRGETEAWDRADGVILLMLFGVFLYFSVWAVAGEQRKEVGADAVPDVGLGELPGGEPWSLPRSAFFTAIGLVGLIAGAELTVAHAVSLAEAFEVPRALIGLTVVAIGTSLPELATSLVATKNGQTSLAIGNVVGSNIFNLLFVLGVTAVISDVPVPEAGGTADLIALALFSAVLIPLSRTRKSAIARPEGALLVLAYIGYMAWRLVG